MKKMANEDLKMYFKENERQGYYIFFRMMLIFLQFIIVDSTLFKSFT